MDFNTFKLSIAVNQETIGGETNLRAYKENSKGEDGSTSFGKPITPSVTYIANQPFNMVKVFDITTFGGHFDNTNSLNIKYTTPHGQESTATGDVISDREWDYRVCIPRNNDADYGNRMRDKVLECTLSSNSNSDDFSLEYVITKYRISWS